MAHLNAEPKDAIEYATVIYTRNAARLVRQHRFDGGPFIIAEFVAHDSRLQFRTLNHAPARIINPARPVAGPLMLRITSAFSGITDMALPAAGSTRSRMTLKRHCGRLRLA